jgi:hypothetical protein
MDSEWTTTSPCACRACLRQKEALKEESGLTITVTNNEPHIHHIHKIFQPEVSNYRCDYCRRRSSTEHPAICQRSLHSFSRFLKVKITAPLTSAAPPPDYHQHGPLRDYEILDRFQLTPQPQRRPWRYTLRAAMMYSKNHNWTYLHGPTPHFFRCISMPAHSK